MKSIKYLVVFALGALAFVSCNKHEIKYQVTEVTSSDAEFQIFNDLASTSGQTASATQLGCIVLGDNDTLAIGTYPLAARNAIPSGNTTRFFVRKPGNYTMKAWKSYDAAKANSAPDYQGSFALVAGKQMVHIYNWFQDPVVIDDDYPYIRPDRPNSVEFIYYNIINMLQELNPGETDVNDHTKLHPTTRRLQYKMRLNNTLADNGPIGRTEWVNIGEPISFGESTGFCPIVVPNKGRGYTGGPAAGAITSGYVRVYTRIEDADTGEILQDEDYWGSQYCGRFYIHTIYPKDLPANEVFIFPFVAL